MSSNDNIWRPKSTGKPDQAIGAGQRGTVGPESESRGGPETPDETLVERFPGLDPNPDLGSRAALPEGSLPETYHGAQGDEHRQPPDNAPAPVNPQPTVETARRGAAGGANDAGRTD